MIGTKTHRIGNATIVLAETFVDRGLKEHTQNTSDKHAELEISNGSKGRAVNGPVQTIRESNGLTIHERRRTIVI